MKTNLISWRWVPSVRTLSYIMLPVLLLIAITTQNAFAATDQNSSNALQALLCTVLNFITQQVGQPIAIGVVITLGILMLIGKINLPTFILTAVGLALMFTANSIITNVLGIPDPCAGVNQNQGPGGNTGSISG